MRASIQNMFFKALTKVGTNGATIVEIEKEVPYERHTISKYLSLMESQGLIYHKPVGKAKLWFINTAPLQTVLSIRPEKRSFTEKILSDIISNIPYSLIVIDKEYRIQFTNNQAFETYGNQEGKKFYEAILGKENPLSLRNIRKVVENVSEFASTVVQDKDGKFLNIRASRLINPDKSLSIVLILEDISDRRKAEDLVSEQKMLLEAERETLNNSAIVAETDLNGKITYVNDKFVEVSGYSRKELMGKTHRIINSDYHSEAFFKKMWSTIQNGKIWRGVIRNKSKNGKYYWVDSAIAPVLDKNRKPVKYIAIRFDITNYIKNGAGKIK